MILSAPTNARAAEATRRFDRWDLLALLSVTLLAFIFRFFSPIMPDFFLHPFQGPVVSDCVSHTPINAQGEPGTLCGLAYPFNRGYKDQNGVLSPANGQVFDEVYFPQDAYNDVKGIEMCRPTTVDCRYNYFDPEPPLAKLIIAGGEWGYGWYRAHFQGAKGDYVDLGFNTFGWWTAALGLWNPLHSDRLPVGPPLVAQPALRDRGSDSRLLPRHVLRPVADWDDRYLPDLLHPAQIPALLGPHPEPDAGFPDNLTPSLGVALGLGIASKWIVLAAFASIVFLLVARAVWVRVRGEGPALAGGVNWPIYIAVAVLALTVIPIAIFLASWYPFFARGQFHGVGDLIDYQKASYIYHATLKATHPYGSPWWSWPFLSRPVLYYAEYTGLGSDPVHAPAADRLDGQAGQSLDLVGELAGSGFAAVFHDPAPKLPRHSDLAWIHHPIPALLAGHASYLPLHISAG